MSGIRPAMDDPHHRRHFEIRMSYASGAPNNALPIPSFERPLRSETPDLISAFRAGRARPPIHLDSELDTRALMRTSPSGRCMRLAMRVEEDTW